MTVLKKVGEWRRKAQKPVKPEEKGRNKNHAQGRHGGIRPPGADILACDVLIADLQKMVFGAERPMQGS